MLISLKRRLDVQSVEVERSWTVCFRRRGVEGESGHIRCSSCGGFALWVKCWEKIGTGFCEDLDLALEYLQAFDDDMIEIIENTTEDVENGLIA